MKSLKHAFKNKMGAPFGRVGGGHSYGAEVP